MINIEEFNNRLKKIMDYYSLTNSTFAEKIGVQPSAISHLFSGRNNPSLDFVLKIYETFEEVDLYWLTLGKGEFPIVNKNEQTKKKENEQIKVFDEIDLFADDKDKGKDTEQLEKEKKNAIIKKIIFFFEDNSFEIFEN